MLKTSKDARPRGISASLVPEDDDASLVGEDKLHANIAQLNKELDDVLSEKYIQAFMICSICFLFFCAL